MNKILVPFDGSVPSRAALVYARLIADNRPDATITLAYVVPRHDLLDKLGVGHTSEREAMALLTETGAAIPNAEVKLLRGVPSEAIAAEGAGMGADLIVLGSRGRSLLQGLVLGSTARELLQAATVPLLVVHEPIFTLSCIIAAVQPGGPALRVARAAQALAESTGAGVTLVNVVDADPAVMETPEQFGIPSSVWRDALAAHAERVFGPLRTLAPKAKEVLRYGRAVEELPDTVAAHGAQVIVVARRSRPIRTVEAWTSVAAALAVRGPFATLVV